MAKRRMSWALLVPALLAACAPPHVPPRPPAAPPPSAPTASSPPAAPPAAPPEPPPAFKAALDAARKALAARDFAAADRALDGAASNAGGDLHLGYLVAYYRATRFAYAGDFERAAAAFLSMIPELAKHPGSADEFWAHNAMMMIRAAQGDAAAALAENDQATLAAARGTWNPDARDELAFLKDRWHRAYYTRMLAETRAGTVKQALVLYAETALADYRTRAHPLGEYEDSIAILDAYFAALEGRRDDARNAAKRVDAEKDDDVEDLYLVVVGLEAGGDHAGAEAVKAIMRRPGGVSIARAVMLRFLDEDAKPPAARGVTPWHPTR